ncbi:hypothetical protein FB480_10877 [Agrobacterium vitis]|nr:hypothetical protein FB480_10877 [Agrobacterium vitis]
MVTFWGLFSCLSVTFHVDNQFVFHSPVGFIKHTEEALQRRSPDMAHEGRCNSFNLLHNFLLKSIPIEAIMQ